MRHFSVIRKKWQVSTPLGHCGDTTIHAAPWALAIPPWIGFLGVHGGKTCTQDPAFGERYGAWWMPCAVARTYGCPSCSWANGSRNACGFAVCPYPATLSILFPIPCPTRLLRCCDEAAGPGIPAVGTRTHSRQRQKHPARCLALAGADGSPECSG